MSFASDHIPLTQVVEKAADCCLVPPILFFSHHFSLLLVLGCSYRIMESFAVRYHEENPDVFSCSDTAWVLSFGLMMLNTDMYNRNIKVSQRCHGDGGHGRKHARRCLKP